MDSTRLAALFESEISVVRDKLLCWSRNNRSLSAASVVVLLCVA